MPREREKDFFQFLGKEHSFHIIVCHFQFLKVHPISRIRNEMAVRNCIIYYNKTKRIEKIESEKDGKNTLTTFTYDANNHLKKMVVSIMVNGVESVVATEFLRLQKSDKVTDSLFEF